MKKDEEKTREQLIEALTLLRQRVAALEAQEAKHQDMVEALQQEHDLFHTLMNSIPDHIYFKDTDSRFIRVNQAMADWLNLRDPEQVTGKTDFDYFTKAHAQPAFEDEQDMMHSGQSLIGKVEKETWPDGRETWVSTTKVPLRDEKGEIIGTLGISRDITARKQAEEALQESEKRLRLKLDNLLSPDYDISEEEFRNIINSTELQAIMDDFYALTHIGVAILDMKGNILVATGWQDICTQFHRIHPETSRNCLESDLYLTENVKPGEYLAYKCKNNMWDIATPIVVGGKRIGTLYLGQFFYQDEEVDRDFFAKQAERYGFDKEAYLAALDRVPRWSRERVNRVMDFYTKFSFLVSQLSYSNLKLAKLLQDQQVTEEALRRSEQEKRAILDATRDYVILLDMSMTIVWPNEAVCAAVDVQRDALIGQPCYKILAQREAPYPNCPIIKAMETGRPQEIERERPDGSVWLVRGYPLRNTAGEVTGAVEIMQDITDRKRVEREIRERQVYLESVLRAVPDAIVTLDAQHRIVEWNAGAEKLFGYRRENTLNKNIDDLITSPDVLEEAMEFTQRALDGQEVPPTETVRYRRDGTPIDVVIAGSPILIKDELIGAVAVYTDISERKRAEAKIAHYTTALERSNEELQQFAYIISHDLQEPLRMVKSYLGLLADCYQGELDAKADMFIEYAVDGAERMQAMIRALLDLSRVETRGKAFVPVDVESVLSRTLDALAIAIWESDAVITHDPLPTVKADPTQLGQVFQNLIANAIKFRREDEPPCVHISAEPIPIEESTGPEEGSDLQTSPSVGEGPSTRGWRFAVEDNGIGIAPRQADHIFKIFQRLHTQEEYPGVGIGLALCKRIVERHGGRIWVESELGEGATFYITLEHQ
jgi:PAS domain S-box-containing protein